MAKLMVSKQLRDVLMINQSIIGNLKAQKARAMKILDKYQKRVDTESKTPANRFLEWTKLIEPYSDAVISAQVADYELTKRYEHFIKELITYEQQQLVQENELTDTRENFDITIQKIFQLEKHIQEIKQGANETVTRLRVQAIERYMILPEESRYNDNTHCILCGEELAPELVNKEDECYDCQLVPEELKKEYFENEEDPDGKNGTTQKSPKEVAKQVSEDQDGDTKTDTDDNETEETRDSESSEEGSGEEIETESSLKLSRGAKEMAELLKSIKRKYIEDEKKDRFLKVNPSNSKYDIEKLGLD
jgi:hypothetical protein